MTTTAAAIRLDEAFPATRLGTRTLNTLAREHPGIATLGDLAQCPETELLEVPSFGPRSLALVMEVLAEHGLSLREDTQ